MVALRRLVIGFCLIVGALLVGEQVAATLINYDLQHELGRSVSMFRPAAQSAKPNVSPNKLAMRGALTR